MFILMIGEQYNGNNDESILIMYNDIEVVIKRMLTITKY